MSTTYTQYEAIIPTIYLDTDDDGVRTLCDFLRKHGLSQVNDDGIHFRLSEADCVGYHIDRAPEAGHIHGEGEYDGPVPLLAQLIDQNKICLVYGGSWSSGDGYGYEEEELDPVQLAEQVPTLVLQEVLAKRLEL